MKGLRVLVILCIAALAALGIWLATGTRTAHTDSGQEATAGNAYDYEVRDVVVQQMGPDGSLQYEIQARQITQQPRNGQITATDLVMHRDPPGTSPGGPNRWTVRADSAELPQDGDVLTLKGSVTAQGVPENSRKRISVATEELTYNLQTQDLSTSKLVDITLGTSSFRSDDARVNIKTGAIKVDSEFHATYVPR
jgi:LPS export ABC transporter protein LptC